MNYENQNPHIVYVAPQYQNIPTMSYVENPQYIHMQPIQVIDNNQNPQSVNTPLVTQSHNIKESERTKEWKYHLCDCCASPSVCLSSMFCYPCSQMKLESSIDGEFECCTVPGFTTFLCPNPISSRTQIRERFQIGSTCSRAQDLFTVCLFPICSQVQHIKQMEFENKRTVRLCGEYQRD
eukprot:TRINITY_DN594_c0_g1_i1.p1 TRINITY_DN594_c0_g1~~TRINITY_DN594_c0_g1_i1.p1  ORF type:complete len:180 (-),score=32.54 TRINITY_DN594_c0_g1_i1:73-612(-)